jgi:zinc protease
MQKLLNQEFGHWNGKQPYQKILIHHVDFPAQQVHVLSEQREFGSYQSVLSIPVGKNHPDASALILMNYILGNLKFHHVWLKSFVKKCPGIWFWNWFAT